MGRYFGILAIFLCAGIFQEVEMVKRKQTTPVPHGIEEEEGTPSPPSDSSTGDVEATDRDEIHKHLTPECMETLQKNQALLEALKADRTNEAKSKEVVDVMMKGGCKPLVEYMIKKQAKNSQ